MKKITRGPEGQRPGIRTMGKTVPLTEFERGVLYAAYLICELHDDPTVAGDVLREANLASADIRQLDDCEYSVLRRLNASEHLTLKVK